VRMGIHTGQAVPVNGRYTGVAVHRAARICAAGHGGQVLVSQATQTLLEDEEEDLEVGLRDLGQQRLKDLDRPVQLYQVAAPGLAAQFPPLTEEAPAEVAPPTPLYRRRGVLAVAALVLVALLAAGAFLATRGGGGGLGGVDPNHVGIIDADSGDILAEVEVGARPGPIAFGEGSVWVGNQDERTLTRIDADTREKRPTITLDNRTPTGIAVSPSAIWVANGRQPGGSLQRVDPQFGQVTDTTEDAAAGAITLGGGSLWAVLNSTMKKINTSTGRPVGTSFSGSGDNGIVFGGGSLWVSNAGDASVWRFAPSTFEIAPVKKFPVGRTPAAIAWGENAVWTANAGDGNVSRIDPDSNALTTSQPVGRNPTAIAVGGGYVWVAVSGDGTVVKLDPSTLDVVDTIDTGNYPAGLAVVGGEVWVTVQTPF
jgi:YVTN family beta-propeller protein